MRSHVFVRVFSVKTAIRAALALLSAATVVPVADAAGLSMQQGSSYHATPYDNTGRGPQQTGLEGGGG
jgi:hypothetical protein